MKNYIFIYLGLTLLLFMGYQNCGSKNFSPRTDSSTNVGSNDDGLSTDDIDNTDPTAGHNPDDDDELQDTVSETKINCDNAQKQNRLLTDTQQIVFDDTKDESTRTKVCLFGKDGNLEQKNDFMQARYEQHRKLVLPANAVVCDLDMSTPTQKFKYDDVFVFTFNGRILATNNKTALYMTSPENSLMIDSAPVPIYKYNWLSLSTLPFVNQVDDYCLGLAQGAAMCQWPETEKQGDIQFDFNRDLLIALGSYAASTEQTFGFIITGDNDPDLDCYHERLEFSMSVKYYIKQ